MDWYRKAAEQGDTYAMHNIGFFYQEGHGVPLDSQKAEEWYLRAASRGLANSQYNLAVMYYNGEEVPQDKVKGYAWLLLACESEYTPARNDRAVVEENLTAEQKEQGEKLSHTLLVN
jgi:hypothetical protein